MGQQHCSARECPAPGGAVPPLPPHTGYAPGRSPARLAVTWTPRRGLRYKDSALRHRVVLRDCAGLDPPPQLRLSEGTRRKAEAAAVKAAGVCARPGGLPADLVMAPRLFAAGCPHQGDALQEQPLNPAAAQRMAERQPECETCGRLENLWVCLSCGTVACGRPRSLCRRGGGDGHALSHWLSTQHPLSAKLGSVLLGTADVHCYPCGRETCDEQIHRRLQRFGWDSRLCPVTDTTLIQDLARALVPVGGGGAAPSAEKKLPALLAHLRGARPPRASTATPTPSTSLSLLSDAPHAEQHSPGASEDPEGGSSCPLLRLPLDVYRLLCLYVADSFLELWRALAVHSRRHAARLRAALYHPEAAAASPDAQRSSDGGAAAGILPIGLRGVALHWPSLGGFVQVAPLPGASWLVSTGPFSGRRAGSGDRLRPPGSQRGGSDSPGRRARREPPGPETFALLPAACPALQTLAAPGWGGEALAGLCSCTSRLRNLRHLAVPGARAGPAAGGSLLRRASLPHLESLDIANAQLPCALACALIRAAGRLQALRVGASRTPEWAVLPGLRDPADVSAVLTAAGPKLTVLDWLMHPGEYCAHRSQIAAASQAAELAVMQMTELRVLLWTNSGRDLAFAGAIAGSCPELQLVDLSGWAGTCSAALFLAAANPGVRLCVGSDMLARSGLHAAGHWNRLAPSSDVESYWRTHYGVPGGEWDM